MSEKELKRLGYTHEQLVKIGELYEAGYYYSDMVDIIGRDVSRGAVDYVRSELGLKKRPKIGSRDVNYRELVMSNEGLIRRLAEEGWNYKHICKNIGLTHAQFTIIYKYLPDLRVKSYVWVNPDVRKSIIEDYTQNLMSVDEISRKNGGLDTRRIQEILKEEGCIRNFRETHKLKKQAGKYNYTGSNPHRYLDKAGKGFSKKIKEGVILKFGSACVCCYETNDQHKERLKKSLCVHHIYPYSACKSNDEFNLIPLCYECHKSIHKQMESNKDMYKVLGNHFKEGLDMAELFFDLFDTDLIANCKVL